jgi:hypothetical protein
VSGVRVCSIDGCAKLAKSLALNPATISRWMSGDIRRAVGGGQHLR